MRPWHIVVVVLVFLLLFGIPKLPELARALGRSLRILKSETKGLLADDVRTKAEAQTSGSDLHEETTTDKTTLDENEPLSGDIISPKKRDKR